MKKIFFIAAATLSFIASGCSERDVEPYKNEPALYFLRNIYNPEFRQADSLSCSFFFDHNRLRDTVWVMVCMTGKLVGYDRPIRLIQANAGKSNAAVAGIHYQPFDTPTLADKMVIPASKARALVPIVVLNHESLEISEVRLEIEVAQNEHFRPGINDQREFLVKTTAIAVKPYNWDTFWKYYFGPTWGTEKFRFIIDATGYTDFDYVNTRGELYSDVLLNMSPAEDSRPKGAPLQMVYQSGRYSHPTTLPDGTATILQNQPVFHILTTEDIRTYSANSLSLFKVFADQFYDGTLPPCRPQSIAAPAWMPGDLYLINDGKLYTIYGMGTNVGKYSAAKVGYYSMHKDMIVPAMMNSFLFDTQSSTFYFTTTSLTSVLSPLAKGDGNPIGVPAQGMPYTLESMMIGTDMYMSASAIALFKSNANGKYYYADMTFNSTAYPFVSFHEIDGRYRMPQCKVRAAALSGSFVYFGDGNSLKVYYNSNIPEREVVLHEFATGETIEQIIPYIDTRTWSNHMAVLTNSSGGWKVYVYKVLGDSISEQPDGIFSGSGVARYAMLRLS